MTTETETYLEEGQRFHRQMLANQLTKDGERWASRWSTWLVMHGVQLMNIAAGAIELRKADNAMAETEDYNQCYLKLLALAKELDTDPDAPEPAQ
jgi:hypothetical protein